MLKTPNYNLNKPEETDVVDIADLNANADIIDSELKERAKKDLSNVTDTVLAGKLQAAAQSGSLTPGTIGAIGTDKIGQPSGVAGLDTGGKVPAGQLPAMNYVPTTRKVNGKALSADITLTAADVSAVPTTRKVNGKALSADITLTAADVSAVPTTRKVNNKALSADITLTAADVGAVGKDTIGQPGGVAGLDTGGKVPAGQLPAMNYVPTTRKVNGKALSANITLTAADVSAVPTTRKVNNKALSANITLTAADVSAVPATRKVNNKALSADITLTAADVGAVGKDTIGQPGGVAPLDGNRKLLAANMPTMFGLWKKIAEYTTAGAFTWTAPDLFGGKPYKVGVMIIGGGGSGAVTYTQANYIVTGGASGHALSFVMEVTPRVSYTGVVGAGGAQKVASQNPTVLDGNNGGSTSFNGKTAGGGDGGMFNKGNPYVFSYGGQPSICDPSAYADAQIPPFGGMVYTLTRDAPKMIFNPTECYNPFECKRILGAGGLASGNTQFNIGGRDPVTGLGASDGVHSNDDTSLQSNDATDAGCGTGGVQKETATKGLSVKSGKAGDGAVYIYVQEVSA